VSSTLQVREDPHQRKQPVEIENRFSSDSKFGLFSPRSRIALPVNFCSLPVQNLELRERSTSRWGGRGRPGRVLDSLRFDRPELRRASRSTSTSSTRRSNARSQDAFPVRSRPTSKPTSRSRRRRYELVSQDAREQAGGFHPGAIAAQLHPGFNFNNIRKNDRLYVRIYRRERGLIRARVCCLPRRSCRS